MVESKKIDDGGPAFPGIDGPPSEYRPGMSLREWFAGRALTSVVQSVITVDPSALERAAKAEGYSGPIHGFAAKIAYQYADAMIAARSSTLSGE